MSDIELFLLIATCVLGGLLAITSGLLVFYCIPKDADEAPTVVVKLLPP